MGLRHAGIFVLISWTFSSCLLEEDKPAFKQVTQSTTTNTTPLLKYRRIDFNDLLTAKDTVWIKDQASFEVSPDAVIGYTLMVDGNVFLQDVAKDNGLIGNGFNVNVKSLTPGPHAMTVTLQVKTKSGSLADTFNAEYFEYKGTYVLMVGDISYVPKITDVAVVDGVLCISWSPYPHSDLFSYQIVKFEQNENARTFEVKSRSRTSINDSTYVGGDVAYQLTITRASTQSNSDKFSYKDNYKPKIKIETAGPPTVRYSWSAAPFYNAVKSYELFFINTSGSIGKTITPALDVNGSVSFGYIRDYNLVVSSNYRAVSYKTTHVGIGIPTPELNDVIYDQAKHAYYGFRLRQFLPPNSTSNVLYKLNEGFAVTDSVVNPLTPDLALGYIYKSPDGNHHYIIGRNQIQKFNPDNLAAVTTSSFTSLGVNGTEFSFEGPGSNINDGRGNFAITNNDVLLFQSYAANKFNVYIMDMTSHSVVFATQYNPSAPQLSKPMHLSADGLYFVLDLTLYKFNGTNYVQIATLPYGSSTILYEQFFDGDPSKLLIATNSKIITYDCAALSETSSLDLSISIVEPPRLDQTNKKLIGSSFSNKILVDLSTPSQRSVDAVSSVWLEGGSLFVNLGYVTRNY